MRCWLLQHSQLALADSQIRFRVRKRALVSHVPFAEAALICLRLRIPARILVAALGKGAAIGACRGYGHDGPGWQCLYMNCLMLVLDFEQITKFLRLWQRFFFCAYMPAAFGRQRQQTPRELLSTILAALSASLRQRWSSCIEEYLNRLRVPMYTP